MSGVAGETRHGSEKRRMPHQVMVRCDDALLTALQADADANGRTVAQSVRFHLKAVLFGSDARAVTSGDAGAHDDTHRAVGQASAGSGGVTPGDESS